MLATLNFPNFIKGIVNILEPIDLSEMVVRRPIAIFKMDMAYH